MITLIINHPLSTISITLMVIISLIALNILFSSIIEYRQLTGSYLPY